MAICIFVLFSIYIINTLHINIYIHYIKVRKGPSSHRWHVFSRGLGTLEKATFGFGGDGKVDLKTIPITPDGSW